MWYILISQEKLWHPEYKWCYKCIRTTFERMNFVEYCLKAMLSMLSPVHFKIYHAQLPCETLIAFTKIALPVYHCPIWKGWRNNAVKLIISWTTNEDAIYSLKQHPCPIGNFFSMTPCQGELYCEQLARSYFMATVNHITEVTFFFFFCCGKAQNQIKAAESNNRTESVLSPSQDSLDRLSPRFSSGCLHWRHLPPLLNLNGTRAPTGFPFTCGCREAESDHVQGSWTEAARGSQADSALLSVLFPSPRCGGNL